MRSIAVVATALLLAAPLTAQEAARFAPSGRGSSQLSLMNPPEGSPPQIIKIDYGQPHLRGRTLHADSLVPYDQVWRTGANTTTTLQTDFMIMFGAAHLAAGRYAVFTLPSRDGWLLILQKDEGQQIAEYDAAKDVARIPLRHRLLTAPLESLTMSLIPAMSGLGGELRISWGVHELVAEWSAM